MTAAERQHWRTLADCLDMLANWSDAQPLPADASIACALERVASSAQLRLTACGLRDLATSARRVS